MSRTLGRACAVVAAVLAACLVPRPAAAGLADQYPFDVGLGNDPSVLYFLDFDDEAATAAWHGGRAGYGWTDDPQNVFAGAGALEIQQTTGTHYPMETYNELAPSDVAHVRWYRKWEAGYDWTQHKMPGVYAKVPGAPPGGGAAIPPNGYDKYSCKLFVDWNRIPRFYTYHPEQAGLYGDELPPNLVNPATTALQTERWYCFEMMIQANSVTPGNEPPGNHDGELKMWIDGQLVGHYQNMRFRDTEDLKVNWLTYSAYVGGTWVSQRDQKLWDDQIVVATEYIGPMFAGEPPPEDVWMDHEIKYVNGNYGITFIIRCDDGIGPSAIFTEMIYEGTNGGQLQQVGAFGGISVDDEVNAAMYDGLPAANYDKDQDSWFMDEFAGTGASVLLLNESPNFYEIESGTPSGEPYEDLAHAYIVCTGDVAYTGKVGRAQWWNVVGVLEVPPPGDANWDDYVDGLDYVVWSNNYLHTSVGWDGADFNGDGIADGLDYVMWSNFYSPQPGGAVPEPSAALVLAFGVLTLRRRRWG